MVIMYIDIIGSTQYFEIYGMIAGEKMVQRMYNIAHPIITNHNGQVIKNLGDGILATFKTSLSALLAAIATLVSLNNVRISLDKGTAIEKDNDVFGNVVNKAAKNLKCGPRLVLSATVNRELGNIGDLSIGVVDE